MTRAAENSQIDRALQAAKSGVSKGVEKTAEVASAGLDGAGKLLKTGMEKSSPYAEKAAGATAQGLSTTANLAGKLVQKAQIDPRKLKGFLKRKSKPEEDQ